MVVTSSNCAFAAETADLRSMQEPTAWGACLIPVSQSVDQRERDHAI